MNNELTTMEPLEGEYIAAGEAEHTFTTEDPISESMQESIARQQRAFSAQGQAAQHNQMDAFSQQQSAFRQGAGLKDAGQGLGNSGIFGNVIGGLFR